MFLCSFLSKQRKHMLSLERTSFILTKHSIACFCLYPWPSCKIKHSPAEEGRGRKGNSEWVMWFNLRESLAVLNNGALWFSRILSVGKATGCHSSAPNCYILASQLSVGWKKQTIISGESKFQFNQKNIKQYFNSYTGTGKGSTYRNKLSKIIKMQSI